MPKQVDMYESSIRSQGDRGAVFECDGKVSYFYLCEIGAGGNLRVLDHLQIQSGLPDYDAADVMLRWDAAERLVGLFVRGVLWAAFDVVSRSRYGGAYKRGATPALPADVVGAFMGA